MKSIDINIPESLNKPRQITNKKNLAPYRIKFGFANILFQSEEAGLAPLHTVIIRTLGGNAAHIGIMGAIGGIGSFFQWFGTLLLKKYQSNRKAMITALVFSVIIASLMAFTVLLAMNPDYMRFTLWVYLILGLLLALASGIKMNIETNWIGDLVPINLMGWFTSLKWVVAVLGILCFMMIFGRLSDTSPKLSTYAGIFLFIAFSQFAAILLIRTITDRAPKNANFISSGLTHHEMLNYRSLPFWTFIIYYMFWSGGRAAMYTFVTAYLLDYFNYSMTKIIGIWAIQSTISILMLLLLGKITDKSGHRIPLIIVSGIVASCMFLWVASAWWGIVPIIVYTFINGAAGYTHNMLATNYSLNIFPDKGRSGYLAVSRIFIGGASMASSVAAGVFITGTKGWSLTLLGGNLNHYHLLFLLSSIISLCSIIPLLAAGNRVVKSLEEL